MNDDLRAWMIDYQAGSLAAFDRLYAALAPIVRRVMRQRTSDPARVEDLVQETFLQLHRARHTYDPQYPLLPWALAIARHVWLMHSRTLARRPQPAPLADDEQLAVRAEAAGYADRTAVRDAMRALTRERRQALVWHHVWGFSFREIAARLGIREDAAKLRSSRGMADLRRLLGGATHE